MDNTETLAAEIQSALYKSLMDGRGMSREEQTADAVRAISSILPAPPNDGTFWYAGRLCKFGELIVDKDSRSFSIPIVELPTITFTMHADGRIEFPKKDA